MYAMEKNDMKDVPERSSLSTKSLCQHGLSKNSFFPSQ